jgi:hypothetical protein
MGMIRSMVTRSLCVVLGLLLIGGTLTTPPLEAGRPRGARNRKPAPVKEIFLHARTIRGRDYTRLASRAANTIGWGGKSARSGERRISLAAGENQTAPPSTDGPRYPRSGFSLGEILRARYGRSSYLQGLIKTRK